MFGGFVVACALNPVAFALRFVGALLQRSATRLRLVLLGLIALPACAADHLGSYRWDPGWRGAGGYSALWLDANGTEFVALSDRGFWVRGTLERNAAGAVAGVEVADRGPLLRSNGARLRAGEFDAEAIARVGDTFFVAYEGTHRVMRHAALDEPPARMNRPAEFDRLQANSGFEALASDAAGRLYAIPERSRGNGQKLLPSGAVRRPWPEGEDHPFPVYVHEGGIWKFRFSIPRRGAYLVSGADVGPDGRLYVLERDFAVIGFRSRIRSFALDGSDERLEFETALRAHDNLEGLSVWRDAQGRLRATMLSDDNLKSLQVTEFVDYVLSAPEG